MSQPEAPENALLQRCATNIDRFNPILRAVVCDLRSHAYEQASKAAESRHRHGWAGLLAGVPISIKDAFAVAGSATTNGSAYYKDLVTDEDAPAVGLLRQAGALIHAKDNLSELSCGATNANDLFGDCRNPWDIERVPGGSSGGSAVSVAAGMAVAALGSDAGGSVRIPAALTGVVGLRPTTGRLPNGRGDGVPQGMPELSTPGPLGRRVRDVARVFAAVDRYVPNDPSSLSGERQQVLGALGSGIRGLRIGIPKSYFFEDSDKGVLNAVEEALVVLESKGAVLQEIDLPNVERAHQVLTTIMLPQYVAMTEGRMSTAPDTFGSEVYRRLVVGQETSAADFVDAQRWRAEWKRNLRETFSSVDLIATPTVPVVAPSMSTADMISTTRELSRNTYAWSLADVPAMSLPCGFSDGLPVGLQLVARPWSETDLFRAGDVFQSHSDWHLAIPPYGADPYETT